MPITLEKLFSPTVTTEVEFLGETAQVTWAPFRYTGEMQDLAEKLGAEETVENAAIADLRSQAAEARAQINGHDPELNATLETQAMALEGEAASREAKLDIRDKRALRDMLSKLLVEWEIYDKKKRLDTSLETLNTLPDVFLRIVFLSLAKENQPDPPKAPISNGA